MVFWFTKDTILGIPIRTNQHMQYSLPIRLEKLKPSIQKTDARFHVTDTFITTGKFVISILSNCYRGIDDSSHNQR